MRAGRTLKRKRSWDLAPDADVRTVYATAFQTLPPSELELKAILEECYGAV